MIGRAKALVKRHWPALRLRTLIFAILLFVAALPGFGALFLRVYENTLVRQTEAELVAQAVALAATAESLWPRASTSADSRQGVPELRTMRTAIDLRTSEVLPERPRAVHAQTPVSPEAAQAAKILAPILEATERKTLASIQLIDRHGRIIDGYETGGRYAGVPEVEAALRGEQRTVFRRNGGYQPRYSFEWLSRASALRLHHAHPILVNGQVEGVLLLSRSPRALFRGLYEDRGKILVGVAVIFLLLVLLSGVLARAIVRPVEALSRATRDVAEGRGSVPPEPELSVVEIRQLYADFRTMAEGLKRRSNYIRDFAGSVSHEFKTPLAGIRGAIELIEDHGDAMSPKDRHTFLANMSADADRLSVLVGKLMELAKADMRVPDSASRTNLAPALGRVADSFRSPAFSIEVVSLRDFPSARIEGAAFEAIATALIENSQQAGATSMRLVVMQDADTIRVEVTDNGPGIAKGDRDRVFSPFFTSKRDQGGSGLGLSIARALALANDADLRLEPSEVGATFRLAMRLA